MVFANCATFNARAATKPAIIARPASQEHISPKKRPTQPHAQHAVEMIHAFNVPIHNVIRVEKDTGWMTMS